MAKSKIYKKISAWNNIKNKPDNVDVIAVDDDICMKIHQVWFLLQKQNGLNNVVAMKQPGKEVPVKQIMRSMFDFVYRLATEYGIEYIKIKGKPGKYNFVSRLYKEYVVMAKDREDGEEVRFAHLTPGAIKRLDILRKSRG